MRWIVDNDTLEVCRGLTKYVAKTIAQRIVLSFVESLFDTFRLFAPLNDENVRSSEDNMG